MYKSVTPVSVCMHSYWLKGYADGNASLQIVECVCLPIVYSLFTFVLCNRANSPTKSIPDDAASVGSEIVGKFSLGLDGDSQDLVKP